MSDLQNAQSYYEGGVEPIYRAASGTALHLAMFEGDEPRPEAVQHTKEFLASRLSAISSKIRVLDLGSGYGDAARFLAKRFGCRVVGLNLIHAQNVNALALDRTEGLGLLVSVVEADFSAVPLQNDSFEIVWSQEALLHAPDRGRVIQEVSRLLRPGGVFIITDLLQTGPMLPEEARLIYERVKIKSLESFDSYQSHLLQAGLQIAEVIDLSRYVARSYQDHMEGIRDQRDHLVEVADIAYVDYTIEAMGRWIVAAEEGKLGWGLFVATKP